MIIAMLMAVLAAAPAAQAPQTPLDLAPGTQYDSRIPTLVQVTGHDYGEAISTPEEIAAYFKALEAASGERLTLLEYGRSYEGRPLYVAMIGQPQRVKANRLEALRASLAALADPQSGSPSQDVDFVKSAPVVVWLLHSVHGNEISSSEAAMAEAYHLLAAKGDPTVEMILRDAVIMIDPLQNPDGRARFISSNRQGSGPQPDGEPASIEHDEPWPGGRPNHYLFDMNRDWLALSQAETRARVRFGLQYPAQIVVDLHEMGGDATYYFAPPADPANPYITSRQQDWLRTIGRENARRFDARGFAYFAREVFDSFYPGYGDSWPMFNGAVAMTFEQASTRGLVFRRDDDTLLTYRDAVVHHFTAALSTIETAAANREAILRDYREYRRSAIAEGEKAAAREYLVPPGVDPSRAKAFGDKLVEHGIDVRRLDEPVKVGTRTLPAGTLAISAAQPSYRLLRNLMEPDVKMDEKFLKEQERRRQKRLGDQIYDVTAWSLPLLYDLEVVPSATPITARAGKLPAAGTAADGARAAPPAAPPAVRPTAAPPAVRPTATPPAVRPTATPAAAPPAAPALPTAKAAYLLPWGSGTAAAVAEAVRAGVRIHTGGEPFTIGPRKYDVGTAIVRAAENPPEALARLVAILARHTVEVVPLDSTWVDDGMSLGSMQVTLVKAPKVVLLWDRPASSDSAGWARFVLEQRFGMPVTVVRAGSLRRLELPRYNVIVLPDGSYAGTFGDDDVRRLRDWIAAGGVLVTIADASKWAAGEKAGLLGTATLMRDGQPPVAEKDAKKPAAEAGKPFDYEKAIQPDAELPESVPGAVMRVTLDREHWLAAGLDDEMQAVVEGARVFNPIKLDKGRNVGIYAKKDRLVAGGVAWPNSVDLLAQKAFVIDQPIGRGHIIAFAEDPNFRAVAEATQLLFINAVLLGTSR